MPNRIIKSSICSSETIDSLNWFQEVVFYRLIVNCDDYGRMDARPKLLKSMLFPIKERITVKDVEDALHKLADAGCVVLYEVKGKPYLCLPSWEAHQNIRAKQSKYPSPEEGKITSICRQANTNENICKQVNANAPVIQFNPNPIQFEYNMPGAETPDCTNFISLPLNDKSEFSVTEKMTTEWAELYPAVDVKQELRKMKGWLDSNPNKRKTKTGIKRFITNWLSRTQDSGGNKKEKEEVKLNEQNSRIYEGLI